MSGWVTPLPLGRQELNPPVVIETQLVCSLDSVSGMLSNDPGERGQGDCRKLVGYAHYLLIPFSHGYFQIPLYSSS